MTTKQSTAVTVLEANASVMSKEPSVAPVSALQILQAITQSGEITADKMAVVERIVQLRREEVAEQNKAAFNRAFIALRREIATQDFYVDREAKNDTGRVMFKYVSEQEISRKLEPLLLKHGLTTMFNVSKKDDVIIAELTLLHEGGHSEKREYAVRMGSTNRAKDATQADAGSATTAYRHLCIKQFGLKSRIREDADAHNEGGPITNSQAANLRARVEASGANETKFLAFAGAKTYEEIMSVRLSSIETMLQQKERAKPVSPSQCGTPQDALAAILNAAGYTFDEFRAWAEDEGQWPDASSAATIYECPAAVAKATAGNKAALLAGLAEHTGRSPK